MTIPLASSPTIPFPQQMFQLNNYMHLSPKQPATTFAKGLSLNAYSRGMGALGLPGDLSSSSRFVRVSYVKMNSRCSGDELSSVSQFFHILGSVDQQRGCCEVVDGKYEITLYTSCCNAAKGIYYYTTYDNHQISAVDMHKTDLDGRELACFTPVTTEQIHDDVSVKSINLFVLPQTSNILIDTLNTSKPHNGVDAILWEFDRVRGFAELWSNGAIQLHQ